MPCPSQSQDNWFAPASMRSLLGEMTRLFQEKGIDSPRLSAEVLLAASLKKSREEFLAEYIMDGDRLLLDSQLKTAREFCHRRSEGEPVAYILGKKEFYSRTFTVTSAVLIPRPETELVIDLVLDWVRDMRPSSPSPSFADFGTGSGCIAVTLALELPRWRALALDKSPAALAVAQNNALRLGAEKLAFVQADFIAPPLVPGSLDILVSNPPYVSETEYSLLSPEVRCFEPKQALVPETGSPVVEVSGQPAISHISEPFDRKSCLSPVACPPPDSGLEAILLVINQARSLLKPGGALFMEIGWQQGAALLEYMDSKVWGNIVLHKDLAGLHRVVSAERLS